MNLSPTLNEKLENQDFLLPDGEILTLYNSLGEEHKKDFKLYVMNKLNRDPWAQEIIEQEICTNYKTGQIIDLGQRKERASSLERMRAANDDKYAKVA